jgi:hypothetical protein
MNEYNLDNSWHYHGNRYPFDRNPEYLKNNNPFLIHYESFRNYEYPLITIPKGTVLYSYGKSVDMTIYNLSDNPSPIERDFKFFYPVPYASHGVSGYGHMYTSCTVVTTTDDIRLIALITPSPLTRFSLREPKLRPVQKNGISYYDNGFTKSGEKDFSTDLVIDPAFMKEINVQGYIAIAEEDSFTKGSLWYELFRFFFQGKINNRIHELIRTDREYMTIDILKQLIFKSGTTALNSDNMNTLYLKELLQPLVMSQNILAGVPEIALSPLKSTHFFTTTRAELKHTTTQNNIDNFFNYMVLEHITDLKRIPFVLNFHKHNIKENIQMPLFQLYRPHMKKTYTNFREISYHSDLHLNQVDYKKTYKNQSEGCSFETVTWVIKKKPSVTEIIAIGGKKNKRSGGTKTKTIVYHKTKKHPTYKLVLTPLPAIRTYNIKGTTVHLSMVNNIPIMWISHKQK